MEEVIRHLLDVVGKPDTSTRKYICTHSYSHINKQINKTFRRSPEDQENM